MPAGLPAEQHQCARSRALLPFETLEPPDALVRRSQPLCEFVEDHLVCVRHRLPLPRSGPTVRARYPAGSTVFRALTAQPPDASRPLRGEAARQAFREARVPRVRVPLSDSADEQRQTSTDSSGPFHQVRAGSAQGHAPAQVASGRKVSKFKGPRRRRRNARSASPVPRLVRSGWA